MRGISAVFVLVCFMSTLAACAGNVTPMVETLSTASPAPAKTRMPAAVMPPTQPAPTAAEASVTAPGKDQVLNREGLLADARQLAQIIEDTHPDPYIRGGGKVAFHLRLDQLLRAIPREGMTSDAFARLLRPFLAAIGDSHTELWGGYQVNQVEPGGIPLRFGIVETSLYVAGVLRPEDERLFGARLVAVEGVPMEELLARQRAWVALENEYHVLEEMASHSLWYRHYLQDLLPEWQSPDQITLTLELPAGTVEQLSFDLPMRASRVYQPATKQDLPDDFASGFGYELLELEWAGAPIAYLRVDHMQGFREDAEAIGESGQSIPAATEMFRALVQEMKAAGTNTLIIDLRANGGGSSLMSDILIYFLYGKDVLRSIQMDMLQAGGQVNRYSAQCFTPPNNIGKTLSQINAGLEIPIPMGGYDFRQFFSGDGQDFEAFLAALGDPGFEQWYRATPTFWREYESAEYAGYYLPEHVLVLVGPWTFSSGFSMTRDLYRAGALLVGTPSAQSSNSFGNGLLWHLEHSGLEGQVTRSYFVAFPEESGLGRVLPVHYPLTYARLAAYDFDPNAEFLRALELLPELDGR